MQQRGPAQAANMTTPHPACVFLTTRPSLDRRPIELIIFYDSRRSELILFFTELLTQVPDTSFSELNQYYSNS
jgi:hypothetical protein